MSLAADKYRGTKEYFLVHSELVAAARYRGTISYKQVAAILGLPPTGNLMGKEVGQILGEISEDEVQRGRPMLSALALSASGQPGPGFYSFAKQLGLLADDSSAGHEKFWKQTCDKVYATWQP